SGRVKLQRRAVIGILSLVLVLPACGGGDDDSGGKSAETSKKGASAASNDINPLDRAKLADGGTLKWAISEMPPNFNPLQLDGSLADNAAVVGALLGGPFEFDAAAQPKVKKEYVESAELTATQPKQVVTYKLNPNAIWLDGSPITVADYEAQWKALNNTNDAYKVASTQGYDKIESVAQGADKFEVVVTFREPYVDWQGLFGGLLQESTNKETA